MDLQELSARLVSLEKAREDELQKAAQQAFMGKYGSRISNNNSLGLVILNELNRRGIDTSAADEAVQEILDNLRTEATALLDTIKVNMDEASALMDKIDSMDQSVSAAAMATGSDVAPPTQDLMGDMSMAQDVPAPPQPAPADMPPMDDGAQPQSPMYVPPEAAPQMDMPPDMAISDYRMKLVKRIVSDRRAKNIKTRTKKSAQTPEQGNLNSDILAACGGYNG